MTKSGLSRCRHTLRHFHSIGSVEDVGSPNGGIARTNPLYPTTGVRLSLLMRCLQNAVVGPIDRGLNPTAILPNGPAWF